MYEPRIEHFLEKIRRREYKQAVDYLVGFGLPIVPPLFGLMVVNRSQDIGDPTPIAVFYYASQVIERLGKPCAPFISSRLKSSFYGDREMAAYLLGGLGYTEALPYLIKALNDKHESVKRAAQSAINDIRKRNPGS